MWEKKVIKTLEKTLDKSIENYKTYDLASMCYYVLVSIYVLVFMILKVGRRYRYTTSSLPPATAVNLAVRVKSHRAW